MAEFEDMAISGDLVKALKDEERWFEIVSPPYYEDIPSKEDPDKKERKLQMFIQLSDGRKGTYIPNRTSSRRMAVLAMTNDMEKWVGLKFFWGQVLQMNVFGQAKDVPYVTDKYPVAEKV